VGANLLYAAALTIVVSVIFICGKLIVHAVIRFLAGCIKPRLSTASEGSMFSRKTEPPDEEETLDLSQEYLTEAVGLSYGVVVNSAIVGTIGILFPGTVGLLEVYAVLVFLGGAVFNTMPEPSPRFASLVDFYKDWYGTLAGLALASFAGEGGLAHEILKGVEGVDHLTEAALGASISSLVALFFLYRGTAVQLSHNLFGCLKVSAASAEGIATMMKAGAALTFAWAWEEFSAAQACGLVPEDSPSSLKVQAIWNYVFLSVLIFGSLGKLAGSRGDPWMAKLQQKVKAYHGGAAFFYELH
jgi:hypothetical protein